MKPRLLLELRSPSYLLKKFVSYTKHILRKNDEKIQNCLWKLPAPLSHPASTLSNYSFIHSNGKISNSKRIFFQTSFSRKPSLNFVALLQIWKIRERAARKGASAYSLAYHLISHSTGHTFLKFPPSFFIPGKKIRSSNAATTFFLRFNVKIPAAPKKDLFLKNEDFFADIQLSRFWRENSLKFKNIYNISKCFASQQLPLTASVIFRVNGFPIWSYYIRMPDKKSLEMTPYLPKETVCQIADSCSLDDCHFDSGFFEPEKQSSRDHFSLPFQILSGNGHFSRSI